MIEKNYRLLYVESKFSRYHILRDLLEEESPEIQLIYADSIEVAVKNTEEQFFDGILLHFNLDDSKIDFLLKLVENRLDAPVVVLIEKVEGNIQRFLKLGVSDYIIKGDLNASTLLKTFQHTIERKKAQRQINNSEKKYQSLFNYNPMPMWVLDNENLKFLSVNKAAIKLYGYSEEEFLKMTVRDLWAPDQEKHTEKIVSRNKERFFKLRVRHLKKCGMPIDVEVKSNPLIYENRNARVSLINDVTEKLKALKKIAESEKRFKALVQEGSELIAVIDAENNYTYNSPSCETVFGISSKELHHKNFFDLIHSKDRDTIFSELWRLQDQARIQFSSYRILTANNEVKWIETIATNLKNDPVINGIVLNSRDITEFKEQELQIKHSLERFNIVSKATSDLITDYNIEYDTMNFSESVTEMFGYPIEEVGKSAAWWNDKIHPEDYKKLQPEVQKMKEKGLKNLTVEYRFRCYDQTYKYILDRSYLITDDNNLPVRIIGSMQDITERKRYIMQVEETNKRLREIAWTQSHVVRAPLAKVMGLVDLMKNYKNDLDNFDDVIENVLISANELDQVIRKIARETEREL